MSEHDLLGDDCDDPFCAHLADHFGGAAELTDEERAWRAQHPRPRAGARHRVRRLRWIPPVEAPATRTMTMEQLEAIVERSAR